MKNKIKKKIAGGHEYEKSFNCGNILGEKGEDKMSYLVIENMKLVIEIDNIEDIEEYEKTTMDAMVNGKNADEFDIDIDDTEVSKLNFKEATILYKAHDMIKTILRIETDKLLLYWLKNRDIEYAIEADIDISRYQRDGYVILEK